MFVRSQPARVCGLGCAGDADAFDSQLGVPLQYERIFHQTESFPGPREDAAWAAGRVPVTSFKTLDAPARRSRSQRSPQVRPTGSSTPWLETLRTRVRRDMVLIYFHEPEAEAGVNRVDFAAAFRHVRTGSMMG